MPKKYIVVLSDAELEELGQLLRSGKLATLKITRARILLEAAAGCRDKEIVEALGVGRVIVERVRQRFVGRGLGALNDVPRLGKNLKLDAKGEAHIIAEACSEAYEGWECWILQLLSDRRRGARFDRILHGRVSAQGA